MCPHTHYPNDFYDPHVYDSSDKEGKREMARKCHICCILCRTEIQRLVANKHGEEMSTEADIHMLISELLRSSTIEVGFRAFSAAVLARTFRMGL